jgi:hypothetical protein
MRRHLLHTLLFSAALLALLGSCGFFFSDEGQGEQLTIYLGDVNSARAAFNDLPKDFPKFSDVTIRITSGEKTAAYSRQGNGPFSVLVPSEKYTVDIHARVSHSASGDKFPFAKAFGGSAEGPFRDNAAAIALSLEETEIIIPVKGGTTTSNQIEFVPFINGRPLVAGKQLFFNPENPTLAFDLDPYGNLFTWSYNSFNTPPVYEIAMINGRDLPSIGWYSSPEPIYNIGYDKKNGRIYYTSNEETIEIHYFDLSKDDGTPHSLTMDFTGSIANIATLLIGGIEAKKVIAVNPRNDGADIYIGVNRKSESDAVILKYTVVAEKQAEKQKAVYGNHVEITDRRIIDLRVIDNYVYAITENTIGGDAAIIAIDANNKDDNFKHPSLFLPKPIGDKPYYFQRIVGWDTGFIDVLEYWDDGNGRRISKISRDLKHIEDTGLVVLDTLCWE